MIPTLLKRMLKPFGRIQESEVSTALLMFSYSFLAMTGYNIIKPITRSKFISDLGADNLPYIQLAAGVLIGFVMVGYSRLLSRLPRRWCLQITQAGIAAILLAFWFLFQSGKDWISAAFYFLGLILGILLISQFWTLANVVYDPRQAKRLFGFIGGGAPLGGIAGSLILTRYAKQLGTINLLLVSAACILLCAIIVSLVIVREGAEEAAPAKRQDKPSAKGRDAFQILRKSKHLQTIAMIISFAAIGAALIEQQLNMAAEAVKGQGATDAITTFLAQVQLWTSTIGLIVQIWLTSRVHRLLGIGFALMTLPVSLGATAVIMLLNAALWAPGLARVFDQSLRYTLDKTTREILFMPLPMELKYQAKPFVDVTVDRVAKGFGAVLLLVLIKPWGLHLGWQQISYASVSMTVLWLAMALHAKRGYLAEFKRSIETREVKPSEVRLGVVDLSTIETLVEELASPDERRVLYAVDLLESLDKRNLISPLLLNHESAAVRTRALDAIGSAKPEIVTRWFPAIQRMISDESPDVRAAAVGALANIRSDEVAELVRPHLAEKNPRIALTAAMVLAGSEREKDAGAAEEVLTRLVFDTRESAASVRRDFAIAIRHIAKPSCRRLLIPLLHDSNSDVAEEAMRSVRKLGKADFIFVPTLVFLLRNRRFKSRAREALVECGEEALAVLGHFLRDPEEDIWVRRHIPATMARIPCQAAMDLLVDALAEPDGFLRFKIIAAIERLHRDRPELAFRRGPVEALALKEGARYCRYRVLRHKLLERETPPGRSLLASALSEKMDRTLDRVYRLLGLLYPWKEIAAARWAIEGQQGRARAGTLEYLDNVLTGPLRRQVMLCLEKLSLDEPVRGDDGTILKPPRDAAESLLRLIGDKDPVLSAAAIYFIWERQLQGLAGHLENVLAARDAKDRHVSEAASWVADALRLPEEQRRAPRSESLPAVNMAEQLGQLPLFASVSVDELFRVVDGGRQVRHQQGQLLYQEALIPDNLQFLLAGRMIFGSPNAPTREVVPPAALGFQEVLEGKPMRESVRTTEQSVCLALSNDECRMLLADNTQLVQGLFRMLCGGAGGAADRLVMSGNLEEKILAAAGRGLKPVERALILQAIPLFTDVSADEMFHLASIAEEVALAESSPLFGPGDPPGLYVLLSGKLALESSGNESALHAGPSDMVGINETLAGVPLGCLARVIQEGAALHIDREELFDLLALRPHLLQQLFSALFRSQQAVPAG